MATTLHPAIQAVQWQNLTLVLEFFMNVKKNFTSLTQIKTQEQLTTQCRIEIYVTVDKGKMEFSVG